MVLNLNRGGNPAIKKGVKNMIKYYENFEVHNDDTIFFDDDHLQVNPQSIATDRDDYRYTHGGSEYQKACEIIWRRQNMNYQEIIEAAYDLTDDKRVKNVLSDGETLAYNEPEWSEMTPEEIIDAIEEELEN
jgi:hypothetical protein